jgi:hypothetical protein
MFEALRARFNRQASDGEPADSRELERAKKVQHRKAVAAHLKRETARREANDYGGGGGRGSGLTISTGRRAGGRLAAPRWPTTWPRRSSARPNQ